MLRHLCALVSLLALVFLLSACTGTGFSGFTGTATELMRPPRLTAEQKAIDDALKASVIADPTLKYPKSGDYRSAFVFRDLDGDGVEEAIVFYAIQANEYARIVPLRQENGQWRASKDLPGLDQDVEFIAFAKITNTEIEDVVVGWSNPAEAEMSISIYSYLDGALVKAHEDSSDLTYNRFLIEDLDNSGLSDIFLISRNAANSERASWIRQFSFDGYRVTKTSELQLSDSITKFSGTIAGRLSLTSKQRGIFVDEILTGDTLVTEVYTLSGGVLSAVIEQDMAAPKDELPVTGQNEEGTLEIVPPRSLYEQARRTDTTTVCADVNNDGVIEIPTAVLMPGYEDSDIHEIDPIYLTEYHQLIGGKLERVLATAINRRGGYRVEFPTDWIDVVTVVEQTENGEWQFFKYNTETASLDDISEELLRIRVVSQKDYQDKFLNYITLRTRGAFTYYGFVPPGTGSLAITEDELRNRLFTLL